MPFKNWQVKCLILFIYCLYVGSVCFRTLWNQRFWYQGGERECVYLPAHTPVHWSAMLDLDFKKALKAYLPSKFMSAATSKWNPLHNRICSAFTICWLDPLRHFSSSRSAGSRRDTSSFGGEAFFHRNLQGASETKQSWPAPGRGAQWILAMLYLTKSGKEQIQSFFSLQTVTTTASRILPASGVEFF